MYTITINNKAATLKRLYANEKKSPNYLHDDAELETYIATPTKRAAIALYIFNFGFTWRERPKNVNVAKVVVSGFLKDKETQGGKAKPGTE